MSESGEEFHKHFWKYAIGGIIVFAIGIMVYKIVYVLFINPVTKGIADLLGPAGILLSDFIVGCCKQSDCVTKLTKEDCKSGCGCGWADTTNKCSSKTGLKKGEGGWYTRHCPAFITGLIGLIAFSVFKILSFYKWLKSKTNEEKLLDVISQLTGKNKNETINEVGEEMRIAGEKMDKLSGKDLEYATRRVGELKLSKIIEEIKKTDVDGYKKLKDQIDEISKQSRSNAEEDGVDVDVAEDAAEDAIE